MQTYGILQNCANNIPFFYKKTTHFEPIQVVYAISHINKVTIRFHLLLLCYTNSNTVLLIYFKGLFRIALELYLYSVF